ncbi:TlpA family protein disulfide reductase [Gordonia sp. NPDC003424]
MNHTPTSAGENPANTDPGVPPNARRRSRFPSALRWTLVFVVVMIALIVAIWPRGSGDDVPDSAVTAAAPSGPNSMDAQVSDAQLAAARREAALPACPTTGLAIGRDAALAGVRASCLADGSTYDVGAGTAGKPLVVNMWAVWCLPCRRELPVVADFARRAGDRVTVLAVHAQEGAQNPYLALQFLIENNVRLATVLDTRGQVATALAAPRVFPSTILVRPDGTVAKVLPQVFENPDEIAAAVDEYLGVRT